MNTGGGAGWNGNCALAGPVLAATCLVASIGLLALPATGQRMICAVHACQHAVQWGMRRLVDTFWLANPEVLLIDRH